MAMVTTLIGTFINIILDPILMFKFNMGVTGAALASIIGQFASCVFVLYILMSKKLEISAAHSLTLSYESKCSSLHGHNWQIELFFVGRELNQDGMVIDFTHVKKAVHGKMDHANLNEVFDFNPTAENIGRWLVDLFPECYKATVQESFGNTAVVVDEEKIRGIEHLVP